MQKDSYSLWKYIKYVEHGKSPLACKINDCVGDTDRCKNNSKMWQDHYKSLLFSVKSIDHKTSVTNTLSSIVNESIKNRPFDIVNALKSVKEVLYPEINFLIYNRNILILKTRCTRGVRVVLFGNKNAI